MSTKYNGLFLVFILAYRSVIDAVHDAHARVPSIHALFARLSLQNGTNTTEPQFGNTWRSWIRKMDFWTIALLQSAPVVDSATLR